MQRKQHTRWLITAAATALVAVALIPAAAAMPAPVDETFIPGVTDSGTGVLRDLERRGLGAEPFIPGVTDSTTGVARDLERRGFDLRTTSPTASADDSAFHWDDRSIGMAAALAAALLMAAGTVFLTAKEVRS